MSLWVRRRKNALVPLLRRRVSVTSAFFYLLVVRLNTLSCVASFVLLLDTSHLIVTPGTLIEISSYGTLPPLYSAPINLLLVPVLLLWTLRPMRIVRTLNLTPPCSLLSTRKRYIELVFLERLMIIPLFPLSTPYRSTQPLIPLNTANLLCSPLIAIYSLDLCYKDRYTTLRPLGC